MDPARWRVALIGLDLRGRVVVAEARHLLDDVARQVRVHFESFAETWEAAAYVGSESLAVTSIVCPNGESTIPNNSTSTLCAAS